MFRVCADHPFMARRPLARPAGALWTTLISLLLIAGCDGPKSPPSTNTSSSITSAAAIPPSSGSAETSESSSSSSSLDVEQAAEFSESETPPADAPPEAVSSGLSLRFNEPRASVPARWKEGVHYSVLVPAQPTHAPPGQVEVTEAFWYGCPHCYALEPQLERWRQQGKPAFVFFNRIPVLWGAIQREHARLYYAAAGLGKLDDLHGALFAAIQQGMPLDTREAAQAFFAQHDVKAADFNQAYDSAAVAASLRQAETLGVRYRIASVPTVIVNGKYITDVGRAGSVAQLLALVNDLATLEKSGVK